VYAPSQPLFGQAAPIADHVRGKPHVRRPVALAPANFQPLLAATKLGGLLNSGEQGVVVATHCREQHFGAPIKMKPPTLVLGDDTLCHQLFSGFNLGRKLATRCAECKEYNPSIETRFWQFD